MTKTPNIDLVYQALKKSDLFDMDKIEVYYNKNEMLCIKDYTHKTFNNGIAVLRSINYYKKTLTLDILRPNYLTEKEMILNL